ncbi:MAG: hypothetical protein O3B24_00370 [Verrucomicrobia bacterium]|nr:hypothetical protein [Verrucomicrobiota bacterium]
MHACEGMRGTGRRLAVLSVGLCLLAHVGHGDTVWPAASAAYFQVNAQTN